MSIVFIVPRASVWNPANERGRRFLTAAAEYGDRVGLDPGLPFESDEVIVDVKRFRAFAQRVLDDYVNSDDAEREKLGVQLLSFRCRPIRRHLKDRRACSALGVWAATAEPHP